MITKPIRFIDTLFYENEIITILFLIIICIYIKNIYERRRF